MYNLFAGARELTSPLAHAVLSTVGHVQETIIVLVLLIDGRHTGTAERRGGGGGGGGGEGGRKKGVERKEGERRGFMHLALGLTKASVAHDHNNTNNCHNRV